MSIESRKRRQLSFYKRRIRRAKLWCGGYCVDCGETNLDRLEFDHLNPQEKSYNITRRWSIKWATLRRELMKCVLRCSDCHLDRTIADGQRITDGRPGAEHINRQIERTR